MDCYIIDVHPKGFECFRFMLEERQVLNIKYSVIKGGNLDIDFLILLGAQPVLSRSKSREGDFTFPSHVKGEYNVCFDNQISRFTPKRVSFDIHVIEKEPGKRVKNQSENINSEILELSESFRAYQTELKMVELSYSALTELSESTNGRVLVVSLIRIIVTLSCFMIQLAIIKRLLRRKSNY